MTQEFIPYEQALALKELGFDEPTSFYWEDDVIRPLPMKDEIGAFHFNRHAHTENEWICAPTFSQAFRWFRKKCNLFGCIDLHVCSPSHWFIRVDKIDINDYLYHSEDEHIQYNTYEEAELDCLIKLIEIVKEKK